MASPFSLSFALLLNLIGKQDPRILPMTTTCSVPSIEVDVRIKTSKASGSRSSVDLGALLVGNPETLEAILACLCHSLVFPVLHGGMDVLTGTPSSSRLSALHWAAPKILTAVFLCAAAFLPRSSLRGLD